MDTPEVARLHRKFDLPPRSPHVFWKTVERSNANLLQALLIENPNAH